MSSAQILKQAEKLKTLVSECSLGNNETWVSRQALQDLYQKLLIMDLEYALDKKVEQDLWNHAFKNQISALQNQAKDKQNPKRNEVQYSLNLFLETANGFYLQLLQELCTAFNLDLPFRRKSSTFGILKEFGPLSSRMKPPQKTSSFYICQHCLVHLGDIARYRQQVEQAQTYYRHAAHLVPYNGQPYNQLAILEAAKGNKLSTVFYYIRSIAVKHPFPVASTNLEKFYAKISKDMLEYRGKLSMSEIVGSFLQFHAFIHLSVELDRAKRHADKLIFSLPTHITSMSFNSYQLMQMVAINLFAMYHAKRPLGNFNKSCDCEDMGGVRLDSPVSSDEERCYKLVYNMTVSLLDNMLHHTPKQEQKAKEYHTLAALKVIFDWLATDKDLLANPFFKNSTIWPNFSKLLNNLQFHANQKDSGFDPEKYGKMPLPEDCDLQCFLPMQKSLSYLDLNLMPTEGLPSEMETRLRCHRLVMHGLWIADEFPSLNLINYQRLKSGRLQFSAPTAQVKVLPGSDGESGGIEKRAYRQNVAIQAIMQNKANKKFGDPSALNSGPGDIIPSRIQHKPEQESTKSDASVMANTARETQIVIQKRDQHMGSGDTSFPTPQHKPIGLAQNIYGPSPPQMVPPPSMPMGHHYPLQQAQQEGGFMMPPGGSSGSGGGGAHTQTRGIPIPNYMNTGGGHHRGPFMHETPHQQGDSRFPGSLPMELMQHLTAPQHHGSSYSGQNSPSMGHGSTGSSPLPVSQNRMNHNPNPANRPPVVSQGMPIVGRPDSSISSADCDSMLFPGSWPPPVKNNFIPPGMDPSKMNGASPPGSGPGMPPPPQGGGGNNSVFGPSTMYKNPEEMNSRLSGISMHSPGLTFNKKDTELQLADIGIIDLKAFRDSDMDQPFNPPKPDSPTIPMDNNQGMPMFRYGSTDGIDLPLSSSYSFFKDTAWTASFSNIDQGVPQGIPSSESYSREDKGTSLSQNLNNVGYGFGVSDGKWVSPPSPQRPADPAAGGNANLSSSIQSIWSSGPSPLERLLEQQKQQRQTDPH